MVHEVMVHFTLVGALQSVHTANCKLYTNVKYNADGAQGILNTIKSTAG